MNGVGPVAFLINELRHRGAQRVLVDDANRFSRAGAPVLFLTLYRDAGRPSIATELDPAVEHVVLDATGPFDLRAVARCVKLLRARRIDTLVTSLNDANIFGRWVALASRMKVRLLRRESNTPRRKRLWQRTLDVVFDGATYRVVAVADDVRRDTLRLSPWRAGKVVVVQNATPIPPPADRPDRAAPRILTVGGLTEQKDQAVLLEALAALSRDRHRFTAHIVGDGDRLDALRAQASEQGIADRVVFRGVLPHEQVLQEYAAADVFVLSSRWEGCPNVVLEAMAHGLPIVATAAGGVPELVEHNVSGILVPPGDSRALGEGLARVMADRSLRLRMGAAARERAARFTPAERFDQLRRLITA